MHWAIAVPLLICLGTGALLVLVYNPAPTRPYREVISWIHRIAGVFFVVLPVLTLLFGRRDWGMHWSNIKAAWMWRRADVIWLALMPFNMITKRIKLPEEGKFNAGEMLNFMMTTATYPLFVISGVIMWVSDEVALAAWLIHFGLAVAILPLLFGHLYMAIINPASRKGLSGMFSGYVSREWAAHHYRRWFREQFESAGAAGKDLVPAEATAGATGVAAALKPAAEITDLASIPTPMRPFDTDATEIAPIPAVLRDGTPEARRWKAERTLSATLHVARVGLSMTPATLLIVGLCAAGLFLAGIYVAAPVGSGTRYVTRPQVLLINPDARSGVVGGGLLLPGSRIERVSDVGDYALVRDQIGRTGYLLPGVLASSPPPLDPVRFGFPDCQSDPLKDESVAECHQRADDNDANCRESCTEPAEESQCVKLCNERYDDCLLNCDADKTAAAPGGKNHDPGGQPPAHAFYAHATLALSAKRFPEVIAICKEALELGDNADLIFALAEALRRQEKRDECIMIYGRFAELYPGDKRFDDAIFWQGESLLAAGNKHAAHAMFERITEMKQSNFARSARRRLKELEQEQF